MLCDDCKKRPASMHLTKIINNQKIEKYLCEQCAKASGEMPFIMESKFSVQDLLKGMFNYGLLDSAPQNAEKSCEHCGMTYSDFSRTGKVGCSQCYTVYGQRLEPIVRRIQGSAIHTGKIPKRAGGDIERRQRLKNLRNKLEQHIRLEEYEQAAKVRDEIRNLEKEPS